MWINTLEFGSLLSYIPIVTDNDTKVAKTLMVGVKNDYPIFDPPILASDWVADEVKKQLEDLPCYDYFNGNAVLVPAPRAGLTVTGGLWTAQRISDALAKRGLGKTSVPLLRRIIPVARSSTSTAADRTKAYRHYETMDVHKSLTLSDPEEIVLVDDIVTRGATLVGAMNRLAEAYPKARIRAFAAMRTISPPFIFRSPIDPISGMIEFSPGYALDEIEALRLGNTFRKP